MQSCTGAGRGSLHSRVTLPNSTLYCTNNFQPGDNFPSSCPASVRAFCPFVFVPAPAPILIIVILFVVCPQFQVTVLWDTSPLWARPPKEHYLPSPTARHHTDTLHGIGHDCQTAYNLSIPSYKLCVDFRGNSREMSPVLSPHLHLSTLLNKNLYFATPFDFSNKWTLGSSNYCFSHSIKMSTKYN